MQRRVPLGRLEVEGDDLFADIGRDVVSAAIGAGDLAADVTIGVTRPVGAPGGRCFNTDHPPAELDKAQRARRQR